MSDLERVSATIIELDAANVDVMSPHKVNALRREVGTLRESERKANEELFTLRGKASAAEEQAGAASSEAERQERSLRSELQVLRFCRDESLRL